MKTKATLIAIAVIGMLASSCQEEEISFGQYTGTQRLSRAYYYYTYHQITSDKRTGRALMDTTYQTSEYPFKQFEWNGNLPTSFTQYDDDGIYFTTDYTYDGTQLSILKDTYDDGVVTMKFHYTKGKLATATSGRNMYFAEYDDAGRIVQITINHADGSALDAKGSTRQVITYGYEGENVTKLVQTSYMEDDITEQTTSTYTYDSKKSPYKDIFDSWDSPLCFSANNIVEKTVATSGDNATTFTTHYTYTYTGDYPSTVYYAETYNTVDGNYLIDIERFFTTRFEYLPAATE